ncbi:MAG: hypothetical protein K0R51_30 [Cytophagaceae bacterium]|jgi:hypothetical protein|nr:hypothetical protein [Cytophagaceae bacterium]
MKTIEILYNFTPYQLFLEELYEKESKANPGVHWERSIENQYGFIFLKVEYGENTEYRLQTAIKITFEIKNNKIVCSEIYTEDPLKKEAIEKSIQESETIRDAQWHTEPNNTWYHDEETTAYINIADEIAQAGANCSAGDNYAPGQFSEIKVNSKGIFLSQINLHNSRSIDHKNNYHMRKLRFFIPLYKEMKATRTIDDTMYEIGKMQISFSDNSSPVNRKCGERIVEHILQQQQIFEKSGK